MTIGRFSKSLIFYWVVLIVLSKVAISSLIPKSEGFENIIGDENKIKNVPLKDICRGSPKQLSESRDDLFGPSSYSKSYDVKTQSAKHAPRDDASKSEAGASYKIARDVEDSKRSKSEERYVKLHSKLRNSSRKFQSPIDKDVYRDLQNLLVYLKEYQSNKASQLNHADNARLLSHKEFEDMILRDFDKLFGRISQDFYLNLYFNKSLPLVFDIIDWLALNELDNGILLEKLLVNEKVIEGLDFYISSRIILDGGYIEIFKADDIQSYLLKHQNLEEIRNLLNCLEKNHWKRVELGFIKVHLSPSFNIKINDSLMATNTVIGFEEIFKSMEKAHSFNSEWLKVLSMDKETKSAPLFFVEKVFVLHTLRYCKKYFENFNLDSIMEQKVEFFTKSYSLFRRQLIMHEELEDSEYVRTVEFPKNLSVIKHVLSLRKLAINKKPSITEVRLDGISVVFAKALRCMDKSWISRYIWKCNNLILSEQEMLFLNVSAWISSSDEKFTSWLNSKPLQDFYNEVLAINKSYTALGGFLNKA